MGTQRGFKDFGLSIPKRGMRIFFGVIYNIYWHKLHRDGSIYCFRCSIFQCQTRPWGSHQVGFCQDQVWGVGCLQGQGWWGAALVVNPLSLNGTRETWGPPSSWAFYGVRAGEKQTVAGWCFQICTHHPVLWWFLWFSVKKKYLAGYQSTTWSGMG